jgi:hypothetical protein
MVSFGMGPGSEPASWLEGASFLKIPRQAKASALSRIPLGQAPAHPNRDHDKYQIVADVTMNVKPRPRDDGR